MGVTPHALPVSGTCLLHRHLRDYTQPRPCRRLGLPGDPLPLQPWRAGTVRRMLAADRETLARVAAWRSVPDVRLRCRWLAGYIRVEHLRQCCVLPWGSSLLGWAGEERAALWCARRHQRRHRRRALYAGLVGRGWRGPHDHGILWCWRYRCTIRPDAVGAPVSRAHATRRRR